MFQNTGINFWPNTGITGTTETGIAAPNYYTLAIIKFKKNSKT